MATLDGVTVQIIANYLKTVANEAETALIRSAFSPIVKESFDCSVAIISPGGEYWVQADAIPGQLGVLAVAAHNIVEAYDGEISHGDIVISNDPYLGCPHVNDFVTVTPIMDGDRCLAHLATLAHYTDVGGKTPGSMPADATEIFQEGLRMPPRLVYTEGRIDERWLQLVSANSRTPELVAGDLSAQISASRIGLQRVRDAIDRYGATTVDRAMEMYLDYSETLVRSQLTAFASGVYVAHRNIDNYDLGSEDEPARVSLRLTVSDSGFELDYSESSDQLMRPANSIRSNTIAMSLVALRSMLAPGTAVNGGLQRVLNVITRRGSLLDPVLPAPVGARALSSAPALSSAIDCLSQAAPERAVASSSGGSSMPYTWMSAGTGERRLLVDNSLRGGTGATATSDGADTLDNLGTNATNYPVEVLEADYPILIERNEIRHGSGGSGRFHGGNGLRRIVQFLEPGVLSARGHGYQFPPRGAAGGGDGAPTQFWLERDGERRPIPPQSTGVVTRAGDRFIAESPGGGGYGTA